VLARIASHMHTARLMDQARTALDAFGNAVIAMTPRDGKIVWQTPLARTLMQGYMADAELPAWLQATQRHSQGQSHPPLTLSRGGRRLIFSAAEFSENEQWMIVLREESDTAQIEKLMATFKLTQRESEVLNWVIKGKTNRDIGDILGTSAHHQQTPGTRVRETRCGNAPRRPPSPWQNGAFLRIGHTPV
jgi:DNA-binding CsgD family transcriptional regulator